jgi:hypothetical protein
VPARCLAERRHVLPGHHSGAQRASRQDLVSPVLVAFFATVFAVGGLVTEAKPVEAGGRKKVAIVVGPVGGETARYKNIADRVARQARSYGAKVVRIYSPFATWRRVKREARGANVLVYLGHGNGWPSRYAPFQTRTKNGLGLNARAGNGNSNTKYFGERSLAKSLHLARNSVVLLLRLCYASGNSEWGRPSPTLRVARQRVDNYGSGFLRTGARAVIAETLGGAGYIFHGLFRTNRTMHQIFWSSPGATRRYRVAYDGRRSPSWAGAILDPSRPGKYYRSIVGDLGMTASQWR